MPNTTFYTTITSIFTSRQPPVLLFFLLVLRSWFLSTSTALGTWALLSFLDTTAALRYGLALISLVSGAHCIDLFHYPLLPLGLPFFIVIMLSFLIILLLNFQVLAKRFLELRRTEFNRLILGPKSPLTFAHFLLEFKCTEASDQVMSILMP